MKTQSKRLLAVAVALGIALVIYVIATAPLPPDQQQITDAIETARSAAQSRSAGGVMSVISDQYHDSNIANVDQLHVFLMRGLHNSGAIDVSATDTTITVHGDTADSTSLVSIKSVDGNATLFDSRVVVHWKREPAYRLLFFPTTTWRIVSADYSGVPDLGDD